MAGLGYVGAGGMAGLSGSLDDLVKQRMVAQLRAQQLQQQSVENEFKRHTIAQTDSRIRDEGRRTDLDYDKFSQQVKQYDNEAPDRLAKRDQEAAQTGLYAAQSAALARKPQETQEQWQQRLQELTIQHRNRMGEIGAQGANALKVAQLTHQQTGPAAQAQQNEVDDTLSLIDQIDADPSLGHAVGPVDQYVGGPLNMDLTGVNRFKALNDQLVGKMSLAQAGKLKGQGQISDKERAMLAAAATALNRGLSEKDYKTELAKIRAQFQRMKAPAAGSAPPAAVEYDYVPGKGLVPRTK